MSFNGYAMELVFNYVLALMRASNDSIKKAFGTSRELSCFHHEQQFQVCKLKLHYYAGEQKQRLSDGRPFLLCKAQLHLKGKAATTILI